MPIKKWIIQYSIALPALFVMFSGVQYLKGKELTYSIEFGIIWSLLSVAVFAATRVYYFKKGQYCKVCDDLPRDKQVEDGR